ncbi:MAG: hypothetical protein P8R31_00500 [Mariniblastus sp.]|nr:hypothetical protein [Mariniblastus sp.]
MAWFKLNPSHPRNYFGVWKPNEPESDKVPKNELYDLDLFPQSMDIDWVRVYQPK